MLRMIFLFEPLPAGIVCLCSVICMGVQIVTKSQIPEVRLFSIQCKADIVCDLHNFLPPSVILWLLEQSLERMAGKVKMTLVFSD